MKLSLVVTVLNEEKTIEDLIDSIAVQTKLPQEVIFVDGGSSDRTSQIILQKSRNNPILKIKLIKKRGNRSAGRNEAIKASKGNIILSTDAGCTLDKKWIKNISAPFKNPKIEVVAGYYRGKYANIFQKSLIPYVLVMKDKIDNDFLPATRSMAFRKSVWKCLRGFDEELSHNEDYAFALKAKEEGLRIYFQKSAVVNWIPRKNLKEAFIMFLRFAFGDGEAGIMRDKVLLIFARYLFFIYLICIFILIKSTSLLVLILLFPLIYILWSIKKNYRFVRDRRAFLALPVIQITSDVAVLVGTVLGVIKWAIKINYITFTKNNLILIGLIGIYILSLLSVIASGIPNQNHPFPYQMDEWHQFLSVKNVFKYGSPNLPGSANGTMFHFLVSGVFLFPFYLLKIIDPFMIKSAVDSLHEQEKLFIILRLITLFFGASTLVVVSKLAKLLKVNPHLAVLIFFATPVWLSLSNFFKYDIALVFWITLSLYFFIKYNFLPTLKNFILGSFFAGIAFSVKVSGLPLLLIVILTYILFTSEFKKKYKIIFLGISSYLFTAMFFGLPDIVFGDKNMNYYLYDNILRISSVAKNFQLENSLFDLNFFHKFPGIFGRSLYLVTIIAIFYLLISSSISLISKKYKDLRLRLFLLLSFFIFFFSLFSLGLFITANRAIVILPFIVFLNLLAFKDLLIFLKNKIYIKKFLMIVFVILLLIQIFESYLWLGVKNSLLPQQSSSKWVVSHVPSDSSIGLENIPIYQHEPDFITKEFYTNQYNPSFQTRYKYTIVTSKTKILPKYIVISNVNFEHKYFKESSKNDLVKRLRNESYVEIAHFPLKIPLYNFFDSNLDNPFLGLTAYPQSISIFKKNK